jgi:hypothetical protein
MPHGDILGLSPPLIIDRTEIDQMIACTRQAVDRVAELIRATVAGRRSGGGPGSLVAVALHL